MAFADFPDRLQKLYKKRVWVCDCVSDLFLSTCLAIDMPTEKDDHSLAESNKTITGENAGNANTFGEPNANAVDVDGM